MFVSQKSNFTLIIWNRVAVQHVLFWFWFCILLSFGGEEGLWRWTISLKLIWMRITQKTNFNTLNEMIKAIYWYVWSTKPLLRLNRLWNNFSNDYLNLHSTSYISKDRGIGKKDNQWPVYWWNNWIWQTILVTYVLRCEKQDNIFFLTLKKTILVLCP